MKTKAVSRRKNSKSAIQLKDLKTKRDAKGGSRDVNSDTDIIVGAGPGAPGGHVK